MKVLIQTLLLMIFFALPASAATPSAEGKWLTAVESKFVCMVTNRKFDREQIAIEVEGKTYYGCCPMCSKMLGEDPAKRSAVDPVSSKAVDKAQAVIGADAAGDVYYFESAANLETYASGPKPEAKPAFQDDHMGMDHH